MSELKYFCDASRHLVCVPYNVEVLHAMAAALGIKRCWFHSDASYPHYDIPKRRVAEMATKCAVISARQLLEIVRGAASNDHEEGDHR